MVNKVLASFLVLSAAIAMATAQIEFFPFPETGSHVIYPPHCNLLFREYDRNTSPEQRCLDGLRLQQRVLSQAQYGVVSHTT